MNAPSIPKTLVDAFPTNIVYMREAFLMNTPAILLDKIKILLRDPDFWRNYSSTYPSESTNIQDITSSLLLILNYIGFGWFIDENEEEVKTLIEMEIKDYFSEG